MKQFSFAKTIPLALALSLALPVIPCAHGANPALNAVEVRTTTPLLQSWKFVQDDALSDDAALVASGAAWQTVSLPHTWNGSDAASTAQTTPASKQYKRGRGWYRLEFDKPSGGATQWLQFDGASIVADVWLNGKKLGQHKGAFTAFRFDVTGKLLAGKNVLLVKTDNSAPTTGSDLTAIAPLSGDFNMSGGLYRDVSLIATPHAAHFALDDLGSSGIFARTTAITGGKAMLSVRAKLNNDARQDGKVSVHLALLDHNGKQVQRAQKSVAIKAGARVEASQQLVVPQPHLWQGMDDPYLYKLVVELRDKAGVTIDKVVQDIGIRQMRFDADKGFFLNGKLTPLHGVSLHQDYIDKGWAIGKAEIDESLGLIKELGANTIRLAHYPHSRYTAELADRLGFVVWAEIPFVDRSLTSEFFFLPSQPVSDCRKTSVVPPQFSANLKLQLQELVRQQY
ncbi:glycoside hydrolase family 2 protein, partial [Massilia cavernae]